MLTSISPIDGRYNKTTSPLAKYFSEQALMRYRVIVEGEYLIALSDARVMRQLSSREKNIIRKLYNLSSREAQIISAIETKGYKNIKATDHDVKAVEYFLKDKLEKAGLKNVLEWVHFGLTSEDTNNLSYALMLKAGISDIIIPNISLILRSIEISSQKYKNLPILARTHGQPASPTTFGKEFKIFYARINRQLEALKKMKILAKLNGATGNYNAHVAAFSKVNWIKFSEKFIKILNFSSYEGMSGRAKNLKSSILNLKCNLFTTQIEPHDSYIEIFDCVRRINTILIDFNQDIWRYISDEWIVQTPKAGTIGSSTMPHKINPIKFENSEGNLGIANAIFEFFARKLPISRLQRDLSDSTVQRNIGSAFAYSLIAYEYLLKGLSGISINKQKVTDVLNSHPEVIAEAVQTILRKEGARMPYEQLKELTRGKQITLNDIHHFTDGLNVKPEIKKKLKRLTPTNYTGLADKLAKM